MNSYESILGEVLHSDSKSEKGEKTKKITRNFHSMMTNYILDVSITFPFFYRKNDKSFII